MCIFAVNNPFLNNTEQTITKTYLVDLKTREIINTESKD